MRVRLLSIGFVKTGDGTYVNHEFSITVHVEDDEHVQVETDNGLVTATIEELEDAILSGGFGEVVS